MSDAAPRLRLVRTPPPGFTPLQLLIHHANAAEASLEASIEALGPNLQALTELQDPILEALSAVQELRERAIVLAYTRGELAFRAPGAPDTT